jgi:hypothetical protein
LRLVAGRVFPVKSFRKKLLPNFFWIKSLGRNESLSNGKEEAGQKVVLTKEVVCLQQKTCSNPTEGNRSLVFST